MNTSRGRESRCSVLSKVATDGSRRPSLLGWLKIRCKQKRIERYRFRAKLDSFLAEEGAVAWVQMSRTEGRLVLDNYPIQTLAGFSEMAAYFNIDNGSGKIRGIYTEGNLAVVPIFREWLSPFASLGTTAVVAEPTDATDHVFLSRLGLPAFQFIQDPLDYETRVHHSDLDTFDHLRPEDLRQAAVVLASVLMDAANRERPLPRKVLPSQPRVTDPFQYPDPAKK